MRDGRRSRDEEQHVRDTTETRTDGRDLDGEPAEADEFVVAAAALVVDDVVSPQDDASYLEEQSQVGHLQDFWPGPADSELFLV